MKKTKLMTLALFVGISVSAATLEEQAAEIIKQTTVRQNQMLRTMLDNPYPATGLWRYEDFALAAYWLNERTAEADQELIAEKNELYPETNELVKVKSFHWHAYLLERIYFLFSSHSAYFPGRMGIDAENAVLEMLWNWASPICRKELANPEHVWSLWGSENHHAQAWVGFWGAAQIFKNHPDYQNRTYADGSTPAEMAEAFNAYFKAYVRERASKGVVVEVSAPTYAKYTLNTWYNLADFAEDPELKKNAENLLNVYWADWAIEQINGVRGGSRHRCYPGRTSNEESGGEGPAWYHWSR